MLSVPYAIKNLLHQDHCYKNIRIHFPNGERSDICNDLIVKNSVSFTESLCSQNTLKFGLCESPVFECEVVGVGNIKGATIEVFCEIECSATVSGAEYKLDLQKYVYPMPYGTFIVDESKRQADILHRKIKAFGLNIEVLSTYPYERIRQKSSQPKEEWYTHDITKVFLSDIGSAYNSPTMEETELPLYSGPDVPLVQYPQFWLQSPNRSYELQLYVRYDKPVIDDVNKLCQIDSFEMYPLEDVLNLYRGAISEKLLTFGIYADEAQEGENYVLSSIKDYYSKEVKKLLYSMRDTPSLRYDYREYTDAVLVYPKIGACTCTICTPKEIDIYLGHNEGGAYRFDYIWADRIADTTFVSITDPALPTITFSESSVYSERDNLYYINSFFSDNPFKKVSALLEINGLFMRLSRNKTVEYIKLARQFGLVPLDDLYPGSSVYPSGVTGGKLLPKDYNTCWYNDDYIKPFGAVVCYYKTLITEEGQQKAVDAVHTLYLDGYTPSTDPNTYQIYELKNNEIIDASVWTDSQIHDICILIARNIDKVAYIPVEFTGRGLPYVEAGDTFEILTKSNDSITTIVLNRTIKGEQTLTDSYKSV